MNTTMITTNIDRPDCSTWLDALRGALNFHARGTVYFALDGIIETHVADLVVDTVMWWVHNPVWNSLSITVYNAVDGAVSGAPVRGAP